MKKVGALTVLLLLVLSSLQLAIAAENTTNTTSTSTNTSSTNTTTTSSSSSSQQQDSSKIDKGFDCLEEKVGDCSGLTTQELALTIIATPKDDVFDDCVKELQDRKSADNWGNVRDTALAILALKHAGESTDGPEKWLLKQEKTPTDLIWFIEQDSNEQTECHIKYDSNDYSIIVEENKKIDKNAGTCLTRAQSNFWLKVSPDCYEKEFKVECDKDFIATLLYKDQNSPTIYVLEGTESAPAFGSVTLNVNSKCFGDSSCDYESSVWATLALLETGYDIENYIPYVVAMSNTNKKYLPEAFIYMITNYEDYATQLVENQKLGNYWEADSTAYDKFYDTSLALIAIGRSSSEPIVKAKDWLLFSQDSNGCWKNSIRDTAIVLWALAGRSGKGGSSGPTSVTYCSQANFFCTAKSDCPTDQDLGDSYFCASLSDTCCKTENLKTCEQYGGEECASGKVCTGIEKKASDTTECCTGQCTDRNQETECEANFFTCMSACSAVQESAGNYACNSGQVCCKAKASGGQSNSSWWIWVLVILIVAVLAAIAWVKRDNIKLFLFKLKSRFKKDKGGSEEHRPYGGPGVPPSRPGFPPVRRMPAPVPPRRPMPAAPARAYDRRDPEMQDTFRKLREMADKK
jgi:hypothetical protein